MPTVFAVSACVILALLALLQLVLIVGAPLGRFAWGGANDVLPPHARVASAVSVVLYVAFAVVILQGVGVVAFFPDLVATIVLWLMIVLFFVGFVLNSLSQSAAERRVMAPTSIVLAALCLFVAIAGHVPA